MPIDVIKDLAKVLNTSPAYLMGWTDIKEDLDTSHKYLFFDTAVSAGIPNDIEALTEKDVDMIEIPDSIMGRYAGDKSIFITSINSDSMNNFINDGTIIAGKPIELLRLK